jgi:adenosine deaminase CECR1
VSHVIVHLIMNLTLSRIWKRFDICTRMIKGLFSYESAFKAYTRACIEDFIEDNIQYAEIRPNFPSNALIRDNGIGYIDNTGLLQIIEDEISYQRTTGRYFGGMKVIYCTPRSFSNQAIEDSLNECIELKKKFPDLLCGKLCSLVYTWWNPD